jgi:hypothetical protein
MKLFGKKQTTQPPHAAFADELWKAGFFNNSEDWQRRESLREQVAQDGNWTTSERVFLADAEDLAEGGMIAALFDIGPKLTVRSRPIEKLEERFEEERHSLIVNDSTFVVGPGEDPWHAAAATFFEAVNFLLQNNRSGERAYALYGGNDLHGVFLTPQMLDVMRTYTNDEKERPYSL